MWVVNVGEGVRASRSDTVERAVLRKERNVARRKERQERKPRGAAQYCCNICLLLRWTGNFCCPGVSVFVDNKLVVARTKC